MALYAFVGDTELAALDGKDFLGRVHTASPLLLAWLAWFVVVLNVIGCSFIETNPIPTARMIENVLKTTSVPDELYNKFATH